MIIIFSGWRTGLYLGIWDPANIHPAFTGKIVVMDNIVRSEVRIPLGRTYLGAELSLPADARAVIIFSHGSGSSRFSTRNRQVAGYLQKNNFGTLLLDLLTPEEESQYYNRFDIGLLSQRLIVATQWLEKHPDAKNYLFGFFGASTGAASAIEAAVSLTQVGAIVSRGGRPDLASTFALQQVKAPVLLVVGSLDSEVLRLNKRAFQELKCAKEIVVIEGASHLFEEPGKLEEVAKLAAAWFGKYLKPVSAGAEQ